MKARYLFGLCLLLCVLTPEARSETGSAIFGSWQASDLAEKAAQDIRQSLSIEARVVRADIKGKRFYRVASPEMAEAAARSLIATVNTRGYNTWYLKSTSPAPAPVRQAPVTPSSESTGGRAETRPAEQVTPWVESLPSSEPAPPPEPIQLSRAKQSAPAPAPGDEIKVINQPVSTADTPGIPISIPYIAEPDIRLDGRVDEAIWQQSPGYDNMLVSEPDTAAVPTYATVTRFIYAEKGLYVSAVMEQPEETLVNRLSARDQSLNRDAFHITIDPSGTGLYGYWFEVGLGGTLLDGTVVPERSFSEQWDGPWQGASAVTANGWSAEMFLPWSMMSMPQSDERVVGFWLRRKVAYMDETYSWPALPFNGPKFMSALRSMSVPGLEPKRSMAIFPYVSSTVDEVSGESKFDGGFDFSVRPSSNLQLTGTITPDFGAVESDDVVVNLTAFETFFPEKRLFFLEGNEVFVTSPRSDINRFNSRPKGTGPRATPPTFEPEPNTLVNTRRIGGAAKHITIDDTKVSVSGVEASKPTELLGALKVVGQQGAFRYGVLAASEDDVKIKGTDTTTGADVLVEGPGRDFGVVRGLWEGGGQGRRALGYIGTIVTLPGEDSMTHGVDGHLQTGNGRWRYDGQYLYSNVDSVEGHGMFNDLVYRPSREWINRVSLDYLDENLDISDLGFIARNDAIVLRYGLVRTRTRDMKLFRQMRNSLFLSNQWSTDGFANRIGIFTNQTFIFHNRSEFKWTLNYFPEQWDDRNSRGNGMFKVHDRWFTQFAFGSDSAKMLAWSGTVTTEQESLSGWSFSSDLGFTFKPSGRFSLDFDLRYKRRDGWLVHRGDRNFATYSATDIKPTLATDFFFNARHQLRLTLQWAGIVAEDQEFLEVPLDEGPLVPRAMQPLDGTEDFSISRLTAQLRYRWEIGPLSDLFLVYTRGNNLPTQIDPSLDDLFLDSFKDPIIDVFIVKLRYRFGS